MWLAVGAAALTAAAVPLGPALADDHPWLLAGTRLLVAVPAAAIAGAIASRATARALARAEDERGSPLRAGDRFAGRYEVRALLGEGGGGRAFLADDEVLARRVVLKETFLPAEGPARDLVLREARAAAGVDRPHVLRTLDAIVAGDRGVIVMDCAPRGSLTDRLRVEGPLGWREAARVLSKSSRTPRASRSSASSACRRPSPTSGSRRKARRTPWTPAARSR